MASTRVLLGASECPYRFQFLRLLLPIVKSVSVGHSAFAQVQLVIRLPFYPAPRGRGVLPSPILQIPC